MTWCRAFGTTPDGQGQAVPAEELCAGAPELLEEVRRRIDALTAMEKMNATPTSAHTGAGPDRDVPAGSVNLRPPQAADEIGRLAGYRVLRLLGQGGMGMVYQAEEVRLKRHVALKVMLPAVAANARARQRFLREAQAQAAIEHDHIVAIHQADEADGTPYIAMPLLRGETLADRINRAGRLPLAEVLRIGRETAEGLSAAHEQRLIHRDIKPSNLWLEGKRGRVKILDFGLARAVEAGEDAHLTGTGVTLGTPAYMAPEQARGENVDARCDLFSLGCVLYQMATGALPFQGNNVLTILHALANETPRAPRELNPELPAELGELITKLLAKDPRERLDSAQGAAEMLAVLERTALARTPTEMISVKTIQPTSERSPRAPFANPDAARSAKTAGPVCRSHGGSETTLGRSNCRHHGHRNPAARRLWRRRGMAVSGHHRYLSKDGNERGGAWAASKDGKLEIEKDGKTIPIPIPQEKPVAWKPAGPWKPISVGESPFDKLGPNAIPKAERFAWQPKELVEHHRGATGATRVDPGVVDQSCSAPMAAGLPAGLIRRNYGFGMQAR